MNVKRLIWLLFGFLGLGLGAIGALLPMLPTVPFLMLALFSFGKSSRKLHQWFVSTKLYKNNLESYAKGQGMTWRTKIRIMVVVTLLIGFGFCMMLRSECYIPCAILGCIWLFHILYFVFGVKNCQQKTNPKRIPSNP